MEQRTLQVGDKVMWRGGWGQQAPQEATVEGIDECEPGEKYGTAVQKMHWAVVPSMAVVTLDNGHWAYGSQIEPMPL